MSIRVLMFLTGLVVSEHVHADQQQGAVQILGPAYSRRVTLTQADSKAEDVRLCKGEITSRVEKLSGMTVAVLGQWRQLKVGSKCFEPQDFSVAKLSSGRDPIVGTLEKVGTEFRIVSNGKTVTFGSLPRGLSKLVGKKVIIDAKQMSDMNQLSWKIVTYAPYP